MRKRKKDFGIIMQHVQQVDTLPLQWLQGLIIIASGGRFY